MQGPRSEAQRYGRQQPSFKARQDHVEHIIDVLVDIIILYPDNLITFGLKKTSRLRS
jgi:hypothetical protein